ncbi:MAG TPA: hypothetical protein VFA85_09285 [Terriglobales bacterium]|nr:hypothetical protein [Terriglobales bacterium]
MKKHFAFSLAACSLLALWVCHAQLNPAVSPRVIELTADHDSRYRLKGKTAPTIEAAPGESLVLRITASRAKEMARDGSVHGLVLLNKDLQAVSGWRFYLHPGVQELAVTAPEQPGRYTAVCTVICSDMHDAMKFTLVVTGQRTTSLRSK